MELELFIELESIESLVKGLSDLYALHVIPTSDER